MRACEIIIRPVGGVGTPLKGDTMFGHFCWQVAYDESLLKGGLEKNLAYYAEKPFAVFSSAFPLFEADHEKEYCLKRPDLPLDWLFPDQGQDRIQLMRARKLQKAKKWMLVKEPLKVDLSKSEYLSDFELLIHARSYQKLSDYSLEEPAWLTSVVGQFHNTINRVTGTTGGGEFAPYVKQNTYFVLNTNLFVIVLFDPTVTDTERITKAMERIGKFGYGSDSSTGKGRFVVVGSREFHFQPLKQVNALYCLAPVVPKPGSFQAAFFSPFTRYGKHGDALARAANPFKNPVITADEGAVFVPTDKDELQKSYWGSGLTGLSLAKPQTVFQGYSICLPFHLPDRRGGEK